MSQIQQQANAVLNAMDEARIILIIQLYDAAHLRPLVIGGTRRENVVAWCKTALPDTVDVEYWLDEYRV